MHLAQQKLLTNPSPTSFNKTTMAMKWQKYLYMDLQSPVNQKIPTMRHQDLSPGSLACSPEKCSTILLKKVLYRSQTYVC